MTHNSTTHNIVLKPNATPKMTNEMNDIMEWKKNDCKQKRKQKFLMSKKIFFLSCPILS